MIAVTGATGQLGRHVVAGLLERVPAKEIVAIVRTPSKAADFAAKGVQVREGDYSKPETLAAALKGVEKLVLISASEIGKRAPQHQAVINAAKAAGVKLIAYTSILHGDQSKNPIAPEHVATEKMLAASGIPFVLLRNGWYLENYTADLKTPLAHGVAGCSGDGRIAAATRADFAAAAVVTVTTPGHAGKVYELAGDKGFTKAELAAELAKQSGKPVAHHDLPAEKFKEVLIGAGLPPPYAEVFVEVDRRIAAGDLDDKSGDLSRLIGRPTTTLAAAVAAALKQLPA